MVLLCKRDYNKDMGHDRIVVDDGNITVLNESGGVKKVEHLWRTKYVDECGSTRKKKHCDNRMSGINAIVN